MLGSAQVGDVKCGGHRLLGTTVPLCCRVPIRRSLDEGAAAMATQTAIDGWLVAPPAELRGKEPRNPSGLSLADVAAEAAPHPVEMFEASQQATGARLKVLNAHLVCLVAVVGA